MSEQTFGDQLAALRTERDEDLAASDRTHARAVAEARHVLSDG